MQPPPQNPNSEQFSFPEVEDLPAQDKLPDPFIRLDGTRISSKEEWESQHAYLKAMLSHYQYGYMPPKPENAKYEEDYSREVLRGQGVETEFIITVSGNDRSVSCRANVVTPNSTGPFPVIVKNDRVTLLPQEEEIPADLPEPVRQGARIDDDILPTALSRGYAMCKFVRTDLAPDVAYNRSLGVFPLYPGYDWGTIAVWSWGYQLVIDALSAMPNINDDRIIATGHSRGGKTALCAAIFDERISIAVPNSSGTGGTGSLRIFEDGREPHQTLAWQKERANHRHWWGPRFLEFAERENKLPFDAHTAKALIAPRPLINPHATSDFHANPYGTEITHRAAKRVFEWLGVPQHIAMHWRDGGHGQKEPDWSALLDFADSIFLDKPLETRFNQLNYPDAPVSLQWEHFPDA